MKSLLIVFFAVAACSAFAKEPAMDPVAQTITDSLSQVRPDLQYTEIKKSPVPGIYQVQIEGGPIIYVTEDGSHFFAGDLFQVKDGRFINLREQAFAKIRKQLINQVPLKDMIVFPPEGPVKAVVNVFTDVDCGYCRKLHQEMPELNRLGIEIRYLAFPRAGLNSPSYRKIATAWCATDRQTTLTRLKKGEVLEENVCQGNPVADEYQLGQKMGVTGTPALVLNDGTLIPGYKPAAELAALLGIK